MRFAAHKASKRLAMGRSRSTRQMVMGSANPFSAAGAMASYSNSSPASRRVVASTTTVFGAAADFSRAARFGVSPTTLRSCTSPVPSNSPTTTSPVAMPTRT
ncbi:MAG: hypothetical protein WBD83_01445 [Xanthobacteraceae bacterium]